MTIDVVLERATEARQSGNRVELRTARGWHDGDRLLVAAGRAPNVGDLDLERARVAYDGRGIKVDKYLRTSSKHIYACGDVVGGPQFSHLAGYECFKAVRNALLPGRSTGKADVLPAVTFADPEVARVGPTEAEARRQYGNRIDVHFRPITKADRARCDGDTEGFIKILTVGRKKIIGATIVALRRSIDPVFLPRPILFVDSLPRNPTGKIPKDALQEIFRQHPRRSRSTRNDTP